eukprot:COSAG01_NODE_758_length_13805_cov_23.267912_15_plen_148_part_00
MCAVISGYNGTLGRALAVAVSSRTAGNYTLTVRDHASLGFLTVRANQTVSITGAAAPTGQLALVDAAITVMAGGTLVLRAVHVAQDVTVQPGGAVQNLGSLVSSDEDDARSLCCVWSGRERAQQLPRPVMDVCRITCMRARAEGALT